MKRKTIDNIFLFVLCIDLAIVISIVLADILFYVVKSFHLIAFSLPILVVHFIALLLGRLYFYLRD